MNIIEKNYNWNGSLSKRSKTEYIILHHAEAQTCTADQIHQWHLNNGWTGIGYNYFVRKDGSIYRGRPEDAVGAHCVNYNSVSVGICAEGAYHSIDKVMPESQKRAIINLIRDIRTRYPDTKIVGHRELGATSCPGQYYPFEEIRKGGYLMADMFPDVKESDYAYKHIKKLKDYGIVNGDDKGNYNPDLNITRRDVAIIVANALNVVGK